jgi:hypothetical protein
VGDGEANRVRRIDVDGTITTFAGTGAIGYTGDGGPAPNATLDLTTDAAGLAIDRTGRVFIADSGHGVVRVVSRAGVITTFGP